MKHKVRRIDLSSLILVPLLAYGQFVDAAADDSANSSADSVSSEWTGYASLDTRLFFHSPAHPGQDDRSLSGAFQPEYYRNWDYGAQTLAFTPFFRLDANDDERTHADIRELFWRMEAEQFVFKAGVDTVFWGVAESQHLVDIINQTDLVENIDREDKLGQPMLNLDYLSDWGTWQAYLLPYFRERTFPGTDGRLRSEPVVDTDDAIYESGDEERHVDFALRWSHYFGDWDIGIAHFSGTSREPLLILDDSGPNPSLRPLYLQIDQTSLDVQVTKGAWLWKLEAIYNQNNVNDYYAYVGGFEFTQFGIAGSAVDLGWLLEYNYDDRGDSAATVLQDDIFFGVRLTDNDIHNTRILAGGTVDIDSSSTFANVEASRRLNEHWVLGLEMRLFTHVDEEDPLHQIKDDDYVEIQLTRYF
ncbi:hypothetical protein A8C75_08360 [Marinobacterium aestuarii]|uniref:Porin n=1 Tax=Marinobacterium aestuarii TaxID=1821621 RepID=A0A1A9EYA0_9GAMM|nr:hypothetical protein [Marinobacterium aestuarii]ANG62499.1 hypothetical protein A8C75_08360 [Marinobacterium aestuarii]